MDALLAQGHHVVVVDALVSQVHGSDTQHSRFLSGEASFIRADLCDRAQWADVLSDVNSIVHRAAEVGVGQSMYEIVRYVRGNSLATAVLLEALLDHRDHIGKIVVASSMSIYGKGAYVCPSCGVTHPLMRRNEDLQRHQWEMRCATCGELATPIPTSEEKPLYPTSIYAVTKRDHEERCLSSGKHTVS